MWKIDPSTQSIIMTRGDTPQFKVNCNCVNAAGSRVPYIPQPGDTFVFACKSKYDDRPLFTIPIPSDSMLLKFHESHTKSLETGKYIYEISLNRPKDGYHCTFIQNKRLILTTEVY